MRNWLVVIFVVAKQAIADLTFKLADPILSGHNYALDKGKIPGDPNKRGEDAFSVSPGLLTVCDGVSGNKFSAYYASKLVSLANQQFGINMFEDRVIVPLDPESLKAGLEGSISNFLFAYKKVLADYPVSDEISAEKETELVNLFISLVSDPNPITNENDPKLIQVNDPAFREMLRISTTALSASLTHQIKDENLMIVYKKGNSMLMQLRPKPVDDKFVLEMIYSLQDNSPNLKSPDRISFADYLLSEEEKKEEGKAETRSYDRLEMDIVPIKARDIVITGSDGIFDNLPASLIAILTSAMVKLQVRYSKASPIEKARILKEELIMIMASYIKATSSHEQIEESIPSLRNLDYLNHPDALKERIHEVIDDDKLFKFKEEFDLSDCSIFEIFYLKPTQEKENDKPWLSRCISKLIEHHYPIQTSEMELVSEVFKVMKNSEVLTKAAKVITLLNSFINLHNQILTLYSKSAESIIEDENLRYRFSNIERNLRNMQLTIQDKKNSLSKISAVNSLKSNPDEIEHIEKKIKKLELEIANQNAEYESIKIMLNNLAEKVTNAQKELNKILIKSNQSKEKLIATGSATPELLELVEKIATEAGLLSSFPDRIEAANNQIMQQRKILSVFNIRGMLFNERAGGELGSLKFGAKSDDITVVATIIEEKQYNTPLLESLQKQLASEIKEYAQSLLLSTKLWIQSQGENPLQII